MFAPLTGGYLTSVPRRRVAAAALVLAASATTGCSAGVDDDAAMQARSAGTVFLRLCAEGRGRDVPDLLTGPAQQRFAQAAGVQGGCAAILGTRTAFGAARVTGVRVTGGEATLRIAAPGAPGATLEAQRRGDRWEITNTRFAP